MSNCNSFKAYTLKLFELPLIHYEMNSSNILIIISFLIASDKWNIYKWNISCHINKQRMSQSSRIATLQREPVSPEKTQS